MLGLFYVWWSPGAGKTSIVQSVAQSLKRPFIHLALGGVRDEAELRGHRRAYVGSMPGKIITGLIKAGNESRDLF